MSLEHDYTNAAVLIKLQEHEHIVQLRREWTMLGTDCQIDSGEAHLRAMSREGLAASSRTCSPLALELIAGSRLNSKAGSKYRWLISSNSCSKAVILVAYTLT